MDGLSDSWWYKNIEGKKADKKDIIFKILTEAFTALRRVFISFSLKQKEFSMKDEVIDTFTMLPSWIYLRFYNQGSGSYLSLYARDKMKKRIELSVSSDLKELQ